jgi:beta-hydroxylase
MEAAIGTGILFGFGITSMAYVYLWRGQARWKSLNEYLRKGWPIFTPLNCLLYMFTTKRAATALPQIADFPELEAIQDNWEVIRDEAVQLWEQGNFEKTKDPDSKAFFDLGFRTFYKYGWSKFYLTWYGYTHPSAKRMCPRTVEILEGVPSLNGAMLSVLPPGSQLTRHLDPVAVSLRYHLGLSTPNDDDCFIDVDGNHLSWRDGEAFLFDETYLHHAKNNTDQVRVILMADIKRPMHLIGGIFYFFYKLMVRLTVVPNTEEDQGGLVNKIFSTLSPVLRRSKALKQTNRPAYLVLKWSVNLTLLLVLGLVIYGLILLLGRLF